MFTLLSKKRRVSHQEIAKKSGNHTLVDLKLDKRLKPLPVAKFEQSAKLMPVETLANSIATSSSFNNFPVVINHKEYAIGSAKAGEKVYYNHGDLGLFGCIFEAWKNHWVLRTTPEDWWLPVAYRVAKAIDEAAKMERGGSRSSQKVRDLFVSHEGKQNISIELPVYTIYEANYEQLFAAFSSELEQRIKVPDYAKTMQNDFSTSSSAQIISSQINLMASMQEFFAYEMVCCGCGLRGLEMEGTVEDWERLEAKLRTLREILKPIEDRLGLGRVWFEHVEEVFKNLALTRKSPTNHNVAKWWINILCDTTGTKYVGGGGSMPGKPVQVKAYDGWLVRFLTDDEKILAEDLGLNGGGSKEIRKKLSGVNQVPMKVSLTWCDLSDESTLVAGMMGFKVHKGGKKDQKEDGEVVPSVQPFHMWSMLLPPESPVRGPSSKVQK